MSVVEFLLTAGADLNAVNKVCWSSNLFHAHLSMDVDLTTAVV
jgi:hypothetical protein